MYILNMNLIGFLEKPALNCPILIAGFDGWPNAGSISTDTLNFLKRMPGVKKLAEINPDHFHKYNNIRPYAKVEDGEIKYLLFSPYEFFYKKGKGVPDLILFLGKEPELRWKQFTKSFLKLATDFKIEMLITIGGTYDYITHKQEPWVSGVFNDQSLKIKFTQSGMKTSEYEGPISIHTLLLTEAGEKGIKGLSIWGHAPQYLPSNNLPIIHQILTYLKEVGLFELDLTDLKFKAEELTKQIDLIIQKNPDLLKFIEKLEKGIQDKKENFAQDKVIKIEEFLKKDPHKAI